MVSQFSSISGGDAGSFLRKAISGFFAQSDGQENERRGGEFRLDTGSDDATGEETVLETAGIELSRK